MMKETTRWLLAIVFSAGVLSAAAAVPAEKLEPRPEHQQTTSLITEFITKYHYRVTPLDDGLSGRILDRYLENLDPNRSYFLAQDLAQFSFYRDQLDDYLRAANLEPAFGIFEVFRDRLHDRVEFAIAMLDKGFDFTLPESYQFDRSKAAWPADHAEWDEIWRKRVKNDYLSLLLTSKEPDEIRETLRKRYDGLRRRTEQFNAEDVYQLFINSYTASVEPHTAYFSPRTSENFKINMSLSLEGIGAVLQMDNEYTLVRRIVPGGPADLSKQLKPDDRIVAIAEGSGEFVDVVGWRLDDVVDLIRGAKGTIVRLEILPKRNRPGDPTKTITLVRDKIRLEEQAAQKSLIELNTGKKIGVIEVPTFYLDFDARARGDKDYRSTTRDVRGLIKELSAESIDGLIIDLRGNGGGSLSEATELTGLFIESGPIVQVKDSTGRIEVNRDPSPDLAYGGPLAVLVDRHSASASEIFAGAIQDYRRGIIIGEPTFGKGTVQNLVDLNSFAGKNSAELGQLKTTIAQFFRISGNSTQHRGVIPDIVFPTSVDSEDQGERALDNALPWASVRPASFTPGSAPVDTFARARITHEQRIKSDSGFQLLLEEADSIRHAQEKVEVSLVESVRREEFERLEKEQRTRTNAFRAAIGLEPLPEDVELGEEEDQDEEEDDDGGRSDILLRETANILSDIISFANEPPAAVYNDPTNPSLAPGITIQ